MQMQRYNNRQEAMENGHELVTTKYFVAPSVIFDPEWREQRLKWREQGLTRDDILVYLYFCKWRDEEATVPPSYAEIARDCLMSRQHAINCVARLVKAGLINLGSPCGHVATGCGYVATGPVQGHIDGCRPDAERRNCNSTHNNMAEGCEPKNPPPVQVKEYPPPLYIPPPKNTYSNSIKGHDLEDLNNMTKEYESKKKDFPPPIIPPPNNKEEGVSDDCPAKRQAKAQSFHPDTLAVIEKFNKVTGHRLRGSVYDKRLISGRLGEGHTVDDLVLVAEWKQAEWGSDPRMVQYVRPATLYAPSHFDGYLAAARLWNARGRPSPSLGGRHGRREPSNIMHDAEIARALRAKLEKREAR